MIGRLLLRLSIGGLALPAVAAVCVLAADGYERCPFCRHPSLGEPILNVAHAGASSVAPQNTLAAGQAALVAGADVWGVDVRRTGDGVLVLMHDETLDRTTNVEQVFPDRSPWRVAEFLFDEVRKLDAGSWFIEEDPFGEIADGDVSSEELEGYVEEPVATLREALGFVVANEWLIDIEVKAPLAVDRGVVASELLAVIAETGASDRVLVSSFDHEFLRAVRRTEPRIPIGALALLPPPNPVGTLTALGADVYLPSVVGFTETLLTDLEEQGICVIAWTYNSKRQLRYAVGLPGVDGIYTDFPQRLAELIGED